MHQMYYQMHQSSRPSSILSLAHSPDASVSRSGGGATGSVWQVARVAISLSKVATAPILVADAWSSTSESGSEGEHFDALHSAHF